MNTTEEKIAVMQAYVEGKTIQYFNAVAETWEDVEDPMWNWNAFEYRVKPKVFYTDIPGTAPYRKFKDIRLNEGILQLDPQYKYLYFGRIGHPLCLNKDLVTQLVGVLQRWINTGELE